MSRKINTLVLAAVLAATSITASYAEQAKDVDQKIALSRCADTTVGGSNSITEVKNQQVQDISQEKSLTGRQSPDNTPRPELGRVGY